MLFQTAKNWFKLLLINQTQHADLFLLSLMRLGLIQVSN